jgi:hypothetical protein
MIVNFVGRAAGRDEENSFQAEAALCRPCRRQMPGMNRVERPTKDCDVHHRNDIG